MTERAKQNWLRFYQWIVARPFFSFPLLFKIRNWVYRKTLPIGANFIVQENVSIQEMHYLGGRLHIADNVTILRDVTLDYSGGLVIGENVVISQGAYILSHMHDISNPNKRSGRPIPMQTTICDGAWLGAKCMLMGGVKIGTGAVVGAGTLVTKDIPAHEVWGGVPAKLIKRMSSVVEKGDVK